MHLPRLRDRASLLLLSACLAAPAQAGVNRVFHPVVEPGELESELRGFFTVDDDPAQDGIQVNKLTAAYGVNSLWATEIEFVFEKEPGESLELEAIASENWFQFTEQGEYVVDFGGFLEYERELENDVNEVIVGPIVQKEFGLWVATGNLFVEREFGDDATEHEFEPLAAAQLRYRYSQPLEFGAEYYGDENIQTVGPAIFGELRPGDAKLKYQFAVLEGLNGATPDHSIRWMFELEFGTH